MVNILGVKFHRVTMEQALEKVDSLMKEPGPQLIVTANTEMVMMANQDPLLFEIIRRSALVVPDGIGIVWASRILNCPLEERVPGVELMDKLLERSAEKGWRVFLLGAKPGIADQAAENAKKKYAKLNVVGTYHGYFTKEEEQELISRIKAAKPDLLFLALGVPKQEKWAAANLAKLGIPLAMGVGGSFEILAGTTKRAPKWMCRSGLEWLYRLIKEPWRIGRMMALPQFAILVMLEKMIVKGDLKDA